jgi:very-short-patch-repair endonuclease
MSYEKKMAELAEKIVETTAGFAEQDTESPMELMLLRAMMAYGDVTPWGRNADEHVSSLLTSTLTAMPCRPGCEGWANGALTHALPYTLGAFLLVNYPVGKYRPDFLILADSHGHVFRFIVEVDGHDFHERTKEQAARDKKRDRWFQSEGYSVLRFTGSEVFRDPIDCARQVSTHVMDAMQRDFCRTRSA